MHSAEGRFGRPVRYMFDSFSMLDPSRCPKKERIASRKLRICFGGILASGYLHLPELNKEKLLSSIVSLLVLVVLKLHLDFRALLLLPFGNQLIIT